MRRHNPAFIPRNHKVEEALLAATGSNDFSVMERLLEVLAAPYDHDRDRPAFSEPGASDPLFIAPTAARSQPHRRFASPANATGVIG